MDTRSKILWWAILVGLMLWTSWGVFGAGPPPTVKARVKRVVPPTQGAGAQALVAKAVTVVPAAQTNIVLAWNYAYTSGNPSNRIVFVVRACKTNRVAMPSKGWPVVGVTKKWLWTNSIDKSARCGWFTVTASNTLTKSESEWATK